MLEKESPHNNPENIPHVEMKEGIPPKEFWVVDDDTEYVPAFIKYCEGATKDRKCQFSQYETGKSALDEIGKRKKDKMPMPSYLFVDGELEKDNDELKNGWEVVKRIRAIPEIEQPKIIAHSRKKDCNEEMKKAGADFSLWKARENEKLRKFLSDPEHYQEDTETIEQK